MHTSTLCVLRLHCRSVSSFEPAKHNPWSKWLRFVVWLDAVERTLRVAMRERHRQRRWLGELLVSRGQHMVSGSGVQLCDSMFRYICNTHNVHIPFCCMYSLFTSRRDRYNRIKGERIILSLTVLPNSTGLIGGYAIQYLGCFCYTLSFFSTVEKIYTNSLVWVLESYGLKYFCSNIWY